ncbi:hypothetical protein DFH07DRAFT_984934 [Mycena maculata]|uniref:NAD(P)-binding domain-containing protein n=1 Tax=Mycena maculata TaxID=230809 RepID=A0AAD7IAZ1_9AGAR|nr:hypothetical protein DFH07DRAFT_984934 [Mycena maculata]
MTILLTDTGKSATPLAKLLYAANIPALLTGRSGTVPAPFRGVRFDWLDPPTAASTAYTYLIAPWVYDMFPPMKAFIDLARVHGVTCFVLMSAATCPSEDGGPLTSAVHAYLASLGVEHCALRSSWFFVIRRFVLAPIVNATGSRLIGWILTEDIAFKVLTAPTIEHTRPIMITEILSEILGREIKHRSVSADGYTEIMGARGYLATMPRLRVRQTSGLRTMYGDERTLAADDPEGISTAKFKAGIHPSKCFRQDTHGMDAPGSASIDSEPRSSSMLG